MRRYTRNYVKVKYILAAIIAFLIAVAILMTNSFFDRERKASYDYSDRWRMDDGESSEPVVIDKLQVPDRVVLVNTLPDTIRQNDALCFIGLNVKFKIYVDDELIYEFDHPENLTGKGYGVAYHTVNLKPEQAGKTVKMDIDTVFDSGQTGRLRMMSVENGQEYRSRLAKSMMPSFMISLGVVVIGIILLLLRLVLPYRESQPSLMLLSINALLSGVWLANDTGFVRLATGEISLCRVLDHGCMHIWVLPLVLFVYSVTKERKPIYRILAWALTLTELSVFVCIRLLLHKDSADFTWVLILYYLLASVIVTLMLRSDARYCKENDLTHNVGFFYTGIVVLVVTAIIDILIYMSGVRGVYGRGGFARLGLCAFFILMAFDAIHMWLHEQTSVRQEKIIDKILRYAVSSGDPEVGIRAIIEYVGREFGSGHTFIYENRNDGTFHCTYEWFAEGAYHPPTEDYYDISYEGMIDELSGVFTREHKLVVDNTEATRRLNPMLYTLIKRLRIHRAVVGSLEVGGDLTGLLGFDDPSEERCDELEDIIRLISYFVSQLLLRRNERSDQLRFSYADPLTGAANRRAFVEYEADDAKSQPYGFVMCDINGLKRTNDAWGHEAGDKLIIDVADSLISVFGIDHVYRLGGDVFAVYSFADSEEEFNVLVNRARSLIESKGRSASFGAVYNADGMMNRAEVKAKADSLMHREKEFYHMGRNDRIRQIR